MIKTHSFVYEDWRPGEASCAGTVGSISRMPFSWLWNLKITVTTLFVPISIMSTLWTIGYKHRFGEHKMKKLSFGNVSKMRYNSIVKNKSTTKSSKKALSRLSRSLGSRDDDPVAQRRETSLLPLLECHWNCLPEEYRFRQPHKSLYRNGNWVPFLFPKL